MNENFEDVGVPDEDHQKIPRWLFWSYPFWILLGLFWCYYFWDGSWGWLDRGYWYQLEQAANTTPPYEKPMKDAPWLQQK